MIVDVTEIQNIVKSLPIKLVLHDADTAEYFAGLYNKIFPDHPLDCTTCKGKLQNAYYNILNLSTTKTQVMANKKWAISPDITGFIDLGYNQIEGVPVHVSKANLTDEIAEIMMKHNANYKSSFVKIDAEAEKEAREPRAENRAENKNEKDILFTEAKVETPVAARREAEKISVVKKK